MKRKNLLKYPSFLLNLPVSSPNHRAVYKIDYFLFFIFPLLFSCCRNRGWRSRGFCMSGILINPKELKNPEALTTCLRVSIIMIEKVLPETVSPLGYLMWSPYFSGCRRSLLFCLLKQADNANNQDTNLDEIRICNNHWAALLSWKECEGRKLPPRPGGWPRHTGSTGRQ